MITKKMYELSKYPFISWKTIKDKVPCVEEYLVPVNVKSFITPDTITYCY